MKWHGRLHVLPIECKGDFPGTHLAHKRDSDAAYALNRTKDTVYLRELSTEYRYKLLRDTLRIIESDTIYIPYGVKVADNGKDKSFLHRFSELAKVAFLVVTAALALWVALRNKA